jgi:putative MFS transporter
MFLPEHRGRTWMLFVFQVFQTVGYYGFGTIVPLVLAAKGFPVTTSLTYTTLAFAGYPAGSAASILLVERLDRKWLIVISAFCMAVSGLGLGYSTAAAPIVALGFLYTVSSNVFSNAFHIFQAEIFPTSFRATAAGTAYGLSRLSSAAAPFVLLPILRHWGAGAMFGVVAAAMCIVMADIAWFAPRTTGRTLEEINPGEHSVVTVPQES